MVALATRRWQLETGGRWGRGWTWADGKSRMQPEALAQGGMGRCGQGWQSKIVLEDGVLVLEVE